MMTAPGAPVTVLAPPVSTPPSPSPNHQTATDHTTDAASAGRIVGRQAIPRPISSWMVANAAFGPVRWCSMMPADQVIGWAMTAGLPGAVAASIWPNALVNMNGWYWSTPSSTQIAASPSCSQRRAPGAVQVAARLPRVSIRSGAAVVPLIPAHPSSAVHLSVLFRQPHVILARPPVHNARPTFAGATVSTPRKGNTHRADRPEEPGGGME